ADHQLSSRFEKYRSTTGRYSSGTRLLSGPASATSACVALPEPAVIPAPEPRTVPPALLTVCMPSAPGPPDNPIWFSVAFGASACTRSPDAFVTRCSASPGRGSRRLRELERRRCSSPPSSFPLSPLAAPLP